MRSGNRKDHHGLDRPFAPASGHRTGQKCNRHPQGCRGVALHRERTHRRLDDRGHDPIDRPSPRGRDGTFSVRRDWRAEERIMSSLFPKPGEDMVAWADARMAEDNERVRAVLMAEGRADLVAELDAKLRDIRLGLDRARATWTSISEAQRRVLTLLKDGRR